MTAPVASALLPLKPLFLQGTVAAPVKTPAADTRLALGGLWTPEGSDAIKVRSGIVWGPGANSSVTPCSVYPGGTAGVLSVNTGRLVLQGPTTDQGAYLGAITAQVQRRVADYGGLPTAGQFKAGRVIARVYDQLFGDPVDGWTVELVVGNPATTAASAVLPPVPAGALLFRNFTVDSNGAFTLSGTPQYTAPNGLPVRCTSATRPTNPWPGQQITETDTGKVLEWQSAATGWTPPWGQAWGLIVQQTDPSVTSTSMGGNNNTTTAISLNNAPKDHFVCAAANFYAYRRYRVELDGQVYCPQTSAPNSYANYFQLVNNAQTAGLWTSRTSTYRHGSWGFFDLINIRRQTPWTPLNNFFDARMRCIDYTNLTSGQIYWDTVADLSLTVTDLGPAGAPL